MKIKAEWVEYIHNIRKREVENIFKKFPNTKLFNIGLELGAGDGYVSQLISQYVKYLICTDYNPNRLRVKKKKGLEIVICDAEVIDKLFKKRKFDLIFSSNLLEHLPDVHSALNGIYNILRDDGITIHIMPNTFWKLIQLFFFYPDRIITLIEKITSNELKINLDLIYNKFSKSRIVEQPNLGNNPKFRKKNYNYLLSLLLPTPHGAYKSNLEEIIK